VFISNFWQSYLSYSSVKTKNPNIRKLEDGQRQISKYNLPYLSFFEKA